MQSLSKTTITRLIFKTPRRLYASHHISKSATAAFARPMSQISCRHRQEFFRKTSALKHDYLHHSFSISVASSTERQPEQELPFGTFADPTRPGLFYHFLEPPTSISPDIPVYALSFLPTAPPNPESSTVIGWLPASTNNEVEQEAGLNDFKENPKFRQLLHDAVKDGLQFDVDDIQRNGALQIRQGWMHIHDDRNIPALGRIGDPDDILASVLVEDGKILANTYQPMPAYRICTSDGITQLTEGLSGHLQKFLWQHLDSERQRM